MEPAQATESCRPAIPTGRLSQVFLLAVVLWCAIPLSPNAVDSDFWGHVAYGRDTLQHGLDRTATYSYTARGFRSGQPRAAE